MKRPSAILVIALLIAAIIAAFIYVRTTYAPKHRWHADYRKSSEEPYGMLYFFRLLKEQEAGTTLIYQQAYWELDSTTTNSNFIFAGAGLDEDSVRAAMLLDFVSRGNRALIATDETPWHLLWAFIPPKDSVRAYQMFADTMAHLQLLDGGSTQGEPLRFNYQNLKDTAAPYHWGGYSTRYFSDTLTPAGFRPLAIINDSIVTAFSIAHGKGSFIFHANPITFTNYHMVRREGFVHASKMTSFLHKGPTYWDDRTGGKSTYSSSTRHRNPLKFMFSHPHLVWAWYLFLITVLLYVLFRSKREQRVIPIVPVNQNDSLAYVKTVGTFYFRHGGQKHIAGEMYTLFLADLRARYHLRTDIDQKLLIELVIARSGVNEDVVREVFRTFNYVIKAHTATSEDLINLHKNIEIFNKTRK